MFYLSRINKIKYTTQYHLFLLLVSSSCFKSAKQLTSRFLHLSSWSSISDRNGMTTTVLAVSGVISLNIRGANTNKSLLPYPVGRMANKCRGSSPDRPHAYSSISNCFSFIEYVVLVFLRTWAKADLKSILI